MILANFVKEQLLIIVPNVWQNYVYLIGSQKRKVEEKGLYIVNNVVKDNSNNK